MAFAISSTQGKNMLLTKMNLLYINISCPTLSNDLRNLKKSSYNTKQHANNLPYNDNDPNCSTQSCDAFPTFKLLK